MWGKGKIRARLTAAALAAVAGLSIFTITAAEAQPARTPAKKPTIVLVHGAFADSSGFSETIRRLLNDGYSVVAAANPLRGLSSDATAIKTLLATIEGPIVLVGHSYGGAVISTAATGNTQVKALVYLAAFVPETGESAEALAGKFPGSTVGQSLKPVPLPDGGVDLYIDPKVYHARFAGDLPAKEAAVYAITQRPAAGAALGEPASTPQAWHTIPSYYLVAGADKIIPPAAQAFMAQRAGSQTKVVRGSSHVVFASHPGITVSFIEKAARASVR